MGGGQNIKHQAPNTKETSNSKHQACFRAQECSAVSEGHWCLMFGAFLVFGA